MREVAFVLIRSFVNTAMFENVEYHCDLYYTRYDACLRHCSGVVKSDLNNIKMLRHTCLKQLCFTVVEI